MNINYIYDIKGKPEYAVIPIFLWNKVSHIIDNEGVEENEQNIFDPKKYKGILSNMNINVEEELSKMRDEWERNI